MWNLCEPTDQDMCAECKKYNINTFRPTVSKSIKAAREAKVTITRPSGAVMHVLPKVAKRNTPISSLSKVTLIHRRVSSKRPGRNNVRVCIVCMCLVDRRNKNSVQR